MMKSRAIGILLLSSLLVFAQACAKKKPPLIEEAPVEVGTDYVSASNPNATISPVLQLIRGRWVKELEDPNTPNPATMRLFATADNTLSGRFLMGGGFADAGVAATLKQTGDVFTLTLVDDEIRPHEWIPKTRTLTGAFDAEKKELTLKSPEGEFITWELPGGFTAHYTAYVYRCVLIPTPLPTPTPAAGATGAAGPTGATVAPTPPPVGASGAADALRRGFPINRLATAIAEEPSRPAPTPAPPVAALQSCGLMSSYKDKWSRMSAAE